jgi:plastocyanin
LTCRTVLAASARQCARAGAVLILACAGCDRAAPPRDEGPRVLELAHDTIRLPAGVSLKQIDVARRDGGEFEPATIQARQGDMVRFTARDRGSHAIVFDGAALDSVARDYLERTGQLRGPPLITTDAAWIITLDGAPPGEYPFRCTTHDASGRLQVSAR